MQEGLQFAEILTVAFTLAFALGYLAQRIKLSPILGYLLAGYIIGPYSPGYVADAKVTEELAEVGIVLLMFGVGLHFSWKDLMRVKSIAIPGAIGQVLIATLLGIAFTMANGASFGSGLVIGFAISVASTAVLVRMLSDNNLLVTQQGHIAIGWLIVEDILTVFILLLLPEIASSLTEGDLSFFKLSWSIGEAALKFGALGLIVYLFGDAFAKKILVSASRTRSNELFTLALLTVVFAVAAGATLLLGTSLALGAFIAGMVVGRTDVSHQAAAITEPMKDAFAALFFISVGMLFDPSIMIKHTWTFFGILTIILVAKPLVAFLIVILLKYPYKTALTIALALAQIGEFSFILAEEGWKLKVLSPDLYDIIVACALVSIAINPLLFLFLNSYDSIFSFFSKTVEKEKLENIDSPSKSAHALIIGFGPIGKTVAKTLQDRQIEPLVIDHNVDTIMTIKENGLRAIYGDALHRSVLENADIANARMLVITIPESNTAIGIIQAARLLNSELPIVVRSRYAANVEALEDLDVTVVCCELESIHAFKTAVNSLINR